MNVWAVLPVQPWDEGKTRLAAALSASERANLSRKFFEHALKITRAVFGVSRTMIVSRSSDVLAVAIGAGVQTCLETPGGDLNAALTAAAAEARIRGANAVLSVSCDLPLLNAADLLEMLDALPATGPAAVIAPDQAGTGTNALLLRPTGLIPYAYGAGSFERHSFALEAQGVPAAVVRPEGLAFDIDTQADLERLRVVRPDF